MAIAAEVAATTSSSSSQSTHKTRTLSPRAHMSSFRFSNPILSRTTALSVNKSHQARFVLRPAFNRHVIPSLRSGVSTRSNPKSPNAASKKSKELPPSAYEHATPVRPMQPLNDPSGKSASGTFGWVGMSVLAAAMGFYITQLLYTASRAAENCGVRDLEHQKDVASVYDDTADSFDSEVGVSERLMGLLGVRKTLSQQCRGHVLEVSCGTGRNIGYYDLSPASAIDSLTFIDLSAQMVDVCKKKWQTHYPSTDSSSSSQKFKPGLSIRFSTCSALDAMPPAPNEGSNGGKYDTIIQTMGICSTPSPHQLIRNMTRHLDMTNPDSRILLLEHGRSDYAWLNNILDSSGQKHAEIHGCWYNRDIGAIVRSVADETGLEVVAERRRHLGTTWIYELRPSPSRKGVAANAANADAVGEESKGSSWRSWFGLK